MGFFNIIRFGLDGANLANKEYVAIDIGKGIVYQAKQKGDMCYSISPL